jgi:hypothetical protein
VSEREYDVFDGMGLSEVYDSQRQAWIDWQRAMEALLDFTPKTGRSPWPTPSEYEAAGGSPLILHPDDYANLVEDILGPSWVDELAEWGPRREAVDAWLSLGMSPDENPDLYRVVLTHAGPYRAPDVEPDWTTWLPDCDLAIRSKSIVTWVERDGMFMNRWDARDYDAMKAKWQAQQGDSAIQLDP